MRPKDNLETVDEVSSEESGAEPSVLSVMGISIPSPDILGILGLGDDEWARHFVKLLKQ